MSAPTKGPYTLVTVPTQIGVCHKIGPFPSSGVHSETWACVYADGMRPGITGNAIGDELLANAHLLAASWEMREALERLIEEVEQGSRTIPARMFEALTQARAALAEAQGEGR